MLKNKKIAIIGAGISGITLAKGLSAANEVTIFDKSRGIGGRMATRRVENYHFDHGAQFFTAKSKEFKEICSKAKEDGVIEEWQCRFAEIITDKINRSWDFGVKKPHYVAKPQMNSFCKYLAQGLNILLSKELELAEFKNSKWSLVFKDGESFDGFDYLFFAIPCHQALNFIPENFKYFKIVESVKMKGCFALMLGFKKDLNTEFDAALIKESDISWVSVNSSKPQRRPEFTLLINSTNKWADENIEADQEFVKKHMIDCVKKIVDFDESDLAYCNLHRWRYANSDHRNQEKSLLDPSLNLGLCGDWLISGRVESGFLSALDLSNSVNSI